MLYKIRLKAREKQAECSTILFLSFFIAVLTLFAFNLLPMVFTATVKPLLTDNYKLLTLIVSGVILSGTLIFYNAFSFGCDRFMLKRAENTVAGAGDIFYYFAPSRLVSLCGFLIAFFLRKMTALVLLSVPWIVCTVVLYYLCEGGFSAAVCVIFAIFTVLFFLLSLFTFSRICDTYFPVKYRYIKGDYINFRQLFSDSQMSMMTKLKRLRKMKGSFVGWFMLCIFVVPIPYVWSYYRQCKACFVAEI